MSAAALLLRIAAAALLCAAALCALIFCPDGYQFLAMTTETPWSAVGYINNGCSGALVDAQHVLAAAHCFAFDNTGAWQTGLQYFPNFHPDRPNQTGIAFTGFVVGTRVDTGSEFRQSDWGIGRLASPVAGFKPVPIRPAPSSEWEDMASAGYPRDYKLLTPRSAPAGATCTFGNDVINDCSGNVKTYSRCYWERGIVDPKCKIYKEVEGELAFDCRSLPGNSGSPLFWTRDPNPFFGRARSYYVAGLIHGGYDDGPCGACKTVAGDNHNLGPSAARFQYAPWFAPGVALARTPDGKARTHVVAVDPVNDRVVGRKHKTGTTATNFHYFDLIAEPSFDPQQIEAFNDPSSGRPILLVVTRTGRLYAGVRPSIFPSLPFQNEPPLIWIHVPLPQGFDKVIDLDPLDEPDDTANEIYVLLHPANSRSGGGSVFRLTVSGLIVPNFQWQTVQAPSAVRIAAVRRGTGSRQIFLLADAIAAIKPVYSIWSNTGASWSTPVDVNVPPLALSDIDATTTNVEGLQFVTLYGVVSGGSRTGGIFRNSFLTESSWLGWEPWDLPLYAPLTTARQPAPANIERMTAGRWQNAGARRPVVFITDAFGNIYFTEDACVSGTFDCTPAWARWRSFYH